MTKKECPRCHGIGEVMTRDRMVEYEGTEDESEDIGGTPYPIVCSRCHGEGEIEYFTSNSEKGSNSTTLKCDNNKSGGV